MHNQLTLINKYPRETKTTMQLRKQFPVNEVAQRRRLQAERCRLQCSTTFAIHKKAKRFVLFFARLGLWFGSLRTKGFDQ